MRSPRVVPGVLVAVMIVGVLRVPAAGAQEPAAGRPGAGFGRPITEQAIAPWNVDIRTSDGAGLPPGQGTAAEGRRVYETRCLACHGEKAAGGAMYGTMVGGIGSFRTDRRVVTPGSMYPYAPILFDYIRRAMPMDRPGTLTDDQVYAVSAYLLMLNGLIPETAVMDARSLPQVRMPNRDGFIPDDRPDVRATRCMKDCPPVGAARPDQAGGR